MYTKDHTYVTIVFVSSYGNSSRWSSDKEHNEPVLNLFIMKAYICTCIEFIHYESIHLYLYWIYLLR